MTLTAGSTLQSGRYVIQTVANQTELGITYQATHIYLNQPVILQTLHPTLRDRSNFEQLRQHFLAEVRWLAKQNPFSPTKVLDCFEEAGSPYVVLELATEQTSPQVDDWLSPTNSSLLEPTATQPSFEIENQSPSHVTSSGEPDEASSHNEHVSSNGRNGRIRHKPLARSGIVRAANSSVTDSPQAEAATPDANSALNSTVPVSIAENALSQNGAAQNGMAQNGATATAKPQVQILHQLGRSPQSKSQSKRWLPMALVITSLLGAMGGAVFGLALRFEQSANPNPGASLDRSNDLLGRDQSFPPLDDWPGDELPEINPRPGLPFEPPVRESVRQYSDDYDADYDDNANSDAAPAPADPLPEEEAPLPELGPLPEVDPIPATVDPLDSELPPLKPVPDDPVIPPPAPEPLPPVIDSVPPAEPMPPPKSVPSAPIAPVPMPDPIPESIRQ